MRRALSSLIGWMWLGPLAAIAFVTLGFWASSTLHAREHDPCVSLRFVPAAGPAARLNPPTFRTSNRRSR